MNAGPDPFDLQRFLEAQKGSVYATALRELQQGQKRSHWMWFIFPQLAGLGRSPTARHFAIKSLAEAKAYLAHPVLGPRLRECAGALSALRHRTAEEIFGSVDAVKLHSSMTLFAHAEPGDSLFREVLRVFFGGVPDALSEQLLRN